MDRGAGVSSARSDDIRSGRSIQRRRHGERGLTACARRKLQRRRCQSRRPSCRRDRVDRKGGRWAATRIVVQDRQVVRAGYPWRPCLVAWGQRDRGGGRRAR